MDDVFIGEIKAFPFNWAPYGWFLCDGSSYPIMGYQALFAILGYNYGGVANQTFKVPNLQGRIMVGAGQLQPPAGVQYYELADTGGVESVGLTLSTIPPHTHTFNAATTKIATYQAEETQAAGNGTSLVANVFEHPPTGQNRNAQGYTTNAPNTNLATAAITPFTGGGAVHENRQPYAVINYCIAWTGDFPVRP
ncbi:MAG: phage tail protein [Mucilaginibacter sp.]